MNHSPWYVENVANYERQRIRDDMRQIRIEQKAMKAASRPAEPSQSQPSTLRALRRVTLVVAEAVLAIIA